MKSIKGRLLALLAIVIGTLTTLHAFATYRIAHAEVSELFDQQLIQAASIMLRAQFLPADARRSDPPEQTRRSPDELDLIVWIDDPHRGRIGVSGWGEMPTVPPGFSNVGADTRQLRVFGARFDGRTVVVGQRERTRRIAASRVAARNLMPMAVALPCLFLLSWLAVRNSLRPLELLAAALRGQSANTLAPVTAANLPSELTPIADALNALLTRLSDQVATQRRFLADAAHELRTPMAALRLQLQVLARLPEGPERDAQIADLLRGVSRASRVIEQLIWLVRSEQRVVTLDTRADLAIACREAIDGLQVLAEEYRADLSLLIRTREAAYLAGAYPEELHAIVKNLVENAIRYAGSYPKIDVNLVDHNSGFRLEVLDNGPGIAAENRERVFERFFRGMVLDTHGSGLGLAIVRAIVNRLNGSIELSDGSGAPPRVGLKVTVLLPR